MWFNAVDASLSEQGWNGILQSLLLAAPPAQPTRYDDTCDKPWLSSSVVFVKLKLSFVFRDDIRTAVVMWCIAFPCLHLSSHGEKTFQRMFVRPATTQSHANIKYAEWLPILCFTCRRVIFLSFRSATRQNDPELLPAFCGEGQGAETGAVHEDAAPGPGHRRLLCCSVGQDRTHPMECTYSVASCLVLSSTL